MTTIVIADDHELVRESIVSLLREIPGFNIVGQCSNGRQALKLIARFRPNVAIVDISMPELNGIDTARQIRKISPSTRIIALSIYTDEVYIRDMINAGVSGYIVKSGAAQDLVKAIRTGSRGKVYFSEEISDTAEGIQNNNGKRKNGSSQTECPLTQREREVLQLIGEGYTSVEIASKLKICETTVKTHRNNLMDKLNVRSVAGLTRQAIRFKLVHVE
ncbi:MAG: response regulator transcription factor [Acidobacteria bacterium]|nr:response regulator transcription factor [Acidobacteriota bacterium]